MSDLIDRHKAIRGILSMDVCVIYDDMCSTEEAVEKAIVATKRTAIFGLECMHSAEPERVWTPCDIPPKHHRDVIVRGVEAIGGECVYKVMQWDVDTWRPKNYAPSITWLDWSEI